jgi:hypothetical protein
MSASGKLLILFGMKVGQVTVGSQQDELRRNPSS